MQDYLLIYGLIIRNPLTASLELPLTMSIAVFENCPPPPLRSSASTMYKVNHIDSFEVLVRKRVASFIERLKDSNNSIIFCIDNSWKMKFDIWPDPWIKLLFT